jgi:hypothetical protein
MDQNDPLEREGDWKIRANVLFPRLDLEQLEHDVVHGDMSPRRIGDKHGISAWYVSKFSKLGRWVRLVGTNPLPRGRRPRPVGAPKPKPRMPSERRRRLMVKRLFGVLDRKLEELEMRMDGRQSEGTPQSAADAEREVRNLTTFARLLDKLIQLDEAAKGASKEAKPNERLRSGDAEAIRRDLALRLDRLARARET